MFKKVKKNLNNSWLTIISMHWECSEVPLSLLVDNPFNRNFIFESEIVKELKQTILKHSMEPEDLIEQLYEKHTFDYLFHLCTSCIHSFGIQKIKNNVKQKVYSEPKIYYSYSLSKRLEIPSKTFTSLNSRDLLTFILLGFQKIKLRR